jgi:hypothetical protein
MESNHRFPGCQPGVFAAGPRDHAVAEAGVEPANHEALDLAALPVCVPGRKLQARESHPAIRAYEAPLDTRPPASVKGLRPEV